MSNLYKCLITGCVMLLTQYATAQQPILPAPNKPSPPAKPSVPAQPLEPALNFKIDQALRDAGKKIKAAELELKNIKLDEKRLAVIDAKKLIILKDQRLNLKKEDFKLLDKNDVRLKKLEIELKKHDLELRKDDIDLKKDGGKTGYSAPDPSSIIEKQKQITKTYKVNSKDKLSIHNQYGRITVNTWNKSEIKVDVLIKSYESSDVKAQELLDGVTIVENNKGNLISFKTIIKKGRSPGLWETIKRKAEPDQKRGIEIFYTVYMPSENPLDIDNSYGSIVLPDFKGPIVLRSAYGSLNAKEIENTANKVNIRYGSATIETYSGDLSVEYGSLNLANADKINARISYGSAKINKLTHSANLEIKYTPTFKIIEVDQNVGNLSINSTYSGISLGLDKSSNYNFDVTVSYGGFNYNNNQIVIKDRSPDHNAKGFNPTKNYRGTFGTGNKSSQIIVKSSYGAVKFL